MLIKITKKINRNILVCTRADGSYTKAEMGSQLPFHDIAHYVADKNLGIKSGFYGSVSQGYSIEQLSDKHVIKTLGAEAWLSEILARALGSLYTGSCGPEQFIPLIQIEMKGRGEEDKIPVFDEKKVIEMLEEYTTLLDKWRNLLDGGVLELQF
jgi:hypothetical protein